MGDSNKVTNRPPRRGQEASIQDLLDALNKKATASNPAVVSGGGDASEATLAAVLAELSTKSEEATLAALLARLNPPVTTVGTVTAIAQTVEAVVGNNQTAVFAFSGTGANADFLYEAWDGYNWCRVRACRLIDRLETQSTGILTSSGLQLRTDVTGLQKIRARCTSISSGSITVAITLSVFPTQDMVTPGQATVYQGGAWITYASAQRWGSYSTPLGANAAYTSAAYDHQSFQRFGVWVLADQAGTLQIQYSSDATTWFNAAPSTAVVANTPVTVEVPSVYRYCRVVYTNGAVAQTSFRIAFTSFPI